MNFKTVGQIAGAILLSAGLAGCMDVTMEVAVLSETSGRATTTMTMGPDFYAMAKDGMGSATSGEAEGFCDEEGAVLTENADGSATCVTVSEGTFDELRTGDSDEGARFEVVGPGLVKASFSTAEMSSDISGEETQDEQTRVMMQAFFEGHNVTLRVSGNEIVESNMTIAPDRKSAEIVIPFLDLLNGTTNLPDELYATVKTN